MFNVQEQELPNIFLYQGDFPELYSPSSPFVLQYYQTKDSLMDVEVYKRFLENAISSFRKSRTYRHYKAYLMDLGLDRCQFHSALKSSENKEEKMVDLEMHHAILTIFDIALIITEHVLNTTGYITTFDLIHILKWVHKNNMVGVVMLSKTAHQLYHNTNEFFIHPSMVFGKWWEFLFEFKYGITVDIANKLIWYLNTAIEKGQSDDGGLLDLREHIKDWSVYNDINFR